MRRTLLVAVVFLAGCEPLPRDIEGTSKRIEANRLIRVGTAGPIGAEGSRFLAQLARVRGAEIVRSEQALEPALLALEDGRLDLVVAPFAEDTGWQERVALTPPLDGSEPGDRPAAVRAAARNGENAWVMQVERVSRESAVR